MSYYDDASLVVIPSGFKTSKVYAEKPTDGSGDLAFTRTGDTATRVNSAGLIEKVRTNINTYSEQLDNAAWTKQSTTVTANATTAPNNTLTADKLIATGTTAFHGIFNVNATLSSLHTFSFYAKKAEYNFVTALDQFSGRFLASFNLDTGVVSSGSGASIQSVGNGWYRCAISFDGAASAVVATLAPSPSSASVNYLGDGTSGIFVWGVQLETGDIATDYIPTTTAAVSVGPVANVPRLDYLGSTCPRLLLEPQRTNLWTFSEDLNSLGLKLNVTVSTNTNTSPDGYTNADKLAETSATGNHFIYGSKFTVTSGTTYTSSFFAKQGERRYLVFQADGQTGLLGSSSIYDLQAGTVYFNVNTTNTITPYGNGWYRITVTATASGNGTVYPFFGINQSASNSLQSYAGTAGNGFFLYGFQGEVGAYATSYIPTLTAATRVADAASKTGISSLIGQTEGVAFIDFVWNGLTGVGSYPRIIELATDTNNIIQLYSIAGTTTWGWDIINGGVVQFTGSSTMALGRNKIAVGYKLNDMVIYKNGTLVASDATCTVPATSALGVTGIFNGTAGAQLAASVNQVLLFKTRLTNAEMAELTTI
jgi:hypothetical protein